MKTINWAWAGLSLTLLLLLAGCNWQMFESVEVSGEPTYRVPGGTVGVELADFLDDIEGDLEGDDEDEDARAVTRLEDDPYTIEAKFGIGDDELAGLSGDLDTDVFGGYFPLYYQKNGGTEYNSFSFDIPSDVFSIAEQLPDGLEFA
ncbi:MAG: hypothetical protein ACLFM0_05480, partial [Spirochaetales bacterium]